MATKLHDADERHRAKAARNRHGAEDGVFICECADLRCNATLDLTRAEYEGLRAPGSRFSVKPGHAIPGIELVIAQNLRYAVVQRLGLAGSANAPR
jgi:hypothetical protein